MWREKSPHPLQRYALYFANAEHHLLNDRGTHCSRKGNTFLRTNVLEGLGDIIAIECMRWTVIWPLAHILSLPIISRRINGGCQVLSTFRCCFGAQHCNTVQEITEKVRTTQHHILRPWLKTTGHVDWNLPEQCLGASPQDSPLFYY